MNKIYLIFSAVLLFVTFAFGQTVNLQITVTDNAGKIQMLNFGLDLTATDGLDPLLDESDLPPQPPGNAFDARWWLPPFNGALSSFKDYRAPDPLSFPFTGHKSHVIKFQSIDYPITISWDLPPEIISSSTIGSVSFSGTGSLEITDPLTNNVQVEIDYVNIGPSGPAPVFSIAPPSLDFGSVAVGNSSTLQATVSNTGDADLEISNITSSDAQFTFAPNAFPITITQGNNQVFDISFTPTTAGAQNATLLFTHNATGSPASYSVQGVSLDAGPVFNVSPSSLDFGNVAVGSSSDRPVTVTNTGATNTLNISSASISEDGFSVIPTSATIPAGNNQVFNVTFEPTANGPYTGTLIFSDDAPGSPHNVDLSGMGYIPPDVHGLVFENVVVHHPEDDSYTETMQLKGVNFGGTVINAIQFTLLVNAENDDNNILTFEKIEKGNSVNDANWILDINVIRGPITPNGASIDTIFVLLYSLDQSGLVEGDYDDLLEISYRIANLPALQDSSKSSIKITDAEASTPIGTSIDITPSTDDLTVIAQNSVLSVGDINGDGCLDILDLIMVVDHIVHRDTLTGDAFTRADIAPWTPGTPTPNSDGVVNVQDMSLIQNIILTGEYPDGTNINGCIFSGMTKVASDADVKASFYINSEGISSYLDSKIDIRAVQIEFDNVSSNPSNMTINTDLGQGFYLQTGEILRTLLYDRLAKKYVQSGKNFLADMPFRISKPENISLKNLILIDNNKQKVQNVEFEIINGNPPALPLDYILYQNYPNPFNPVTTVEFQVPKTTNVTITIYNMLGQEVRALFAQQVLRGTYSVTWDGLNNEGTKMSSGAYIYRMTAGDYIQSKKMILLK